MTLSIAETGQAARQTVPSVQQTVPSAPLGLLADGTPFFAPVGEVTVDGDLVICHLCGCWRRSVTAHLRAHGWTKDAYCAAFGLERGQSLEGAATRKMRAASFSARLLFEPAIRAGSARGRARASSGELARDAAVAARGRPLPEQRRRKARQAMAGKRHPDSAEASRERARAHLLAVASRVAAENGFADIGALVRAKTAQGASLAAISRGAGLHKDWLSRHVADLDPSAAAAAAAARTARGHQARRRRAGGACCCRPRFRRRCWLRAGAQGCGVDLGGDGGRVRTAAVLAAPPRPAGLKPPGPQGQARLKWPDGCGHWPAADTAG